MSEYVVRCADEWDPRTTKLAILTIDGNSAGLGRLKGHHAYAYLGLSAPHS